MAIYVWRGDAQPTKQVSKVTFSNVEIGDQFTVTINRKDITVECSDGDTAQERLDNVVALLVAAVGQYTHADYAEFTEVSAASSLDENDVIDGLNITGATDGKPFTVTASSTNAATGGVSCSTVQTATAGLNEKQKVTLADGVTGGTFTLEYNGDSTSAIAYNASASTVETRLESDCADIASGDLTVTGSAGGPWEIEFGGNLAAQDVQPLVGDGTSLTGSLSARAYTETQGSAATNSIWQLDCEVADNNTCACLVTVPGNTARTVRFFANDTPAEVATAFESAATVMEGSVSVSQLSDTSDGYASYSITFDGPHAGQDVTLSAGSVVTVTVTQTQAGSDTAVNEVQRIEIPTALGGTFKLSFDGTASGNIAYDADAAAIESALEATATVGTDNVSVSELWDYGTSIWYEVTFQGDLAATNVPILVPDTTNLTGAPVYVITTQSYVAEVNEVQTVSIAEGISGGTFTLSLDGDESSNIAYDASAATVESTLESSITAITAGDLTVTGDAGGPWAVEFGGNLAGTNVSLMIGDGDDLTGTGTQSTSVSTTTSPTGPEWFDNAENWDQNSVPSDGDTIVFEHSSRDCLYGLDQSSITPADIIIKQSYSGHIGLPPDTGDYVEYRDQYLTLGNSGDTQTITVMVGEGDGTGSPRVKLDTGTAPVELIVMDTGTAESDVPALLWKGTATTNVVRIYRGSVGIAVYEGESAVIEDLEVGYRTDVDGDAEVFCGRDTDVDDVEQSGGSLRLGGEAGDAIETFVQTAGQSVIDGSDGVDSLKIQGGTCFYNSTGTLGGTPVVSGSGVLDFSQDMRAKTVTSTIEIYGDDSEVIDSFKVVSALIVDYNETTRIPNLGRHIRISRSTP